VVKLLEDRYTVHLPVYLVESVPILEESRFWTKRMLDISAYFLRFPSLEVDRKIRIDERYPKEAPMAILLALRSDIRLQVFFHRPASFPSLTLLVWIGIFLWRQYRSVSHSSEVIYATEI
jgi:hypothetical protein